MDRHSALALGCLTWQLHPSTPGGPSTCADAPTPRGPTSMPRQEGKKEEEEEEAQREGFVRVSGLSVPSKYPGPCQVMQATP
ncbi:unnamed protein product [Cutaneotrichosporon oleaginosum]